MDVCMHANGAHIMTHVGQTAWNIRASWERLAPSNAHALRSPPVALGPCRLDAVGSQEVFESYMRSIDSVMGSGQVF